MRVMPADPNSLSGVPDIHQPVAPTVKPILVRYHPDSFSTWVLSLGSRPSLLTVVDRKSKVSVRFGYGLP